MRKIVIMIVAGLGLSLTCTAQKCIIEGTLPDMEGETVHLIRRGSMSTPLGRSTVEDGKLRIEVALKQEYILLLSIPGKRTSFPVMAGPEDHIVMVGGGNGIAFFRRQKRDKQHALPNGNDAVSFDASVYARLSIG